MADGYEDALKVQLLRLSCLTVLDAHTGNTHIITQYFIKLAVPANGNVAVFRLIKQLVCQDFLTTEAITTVNNDYLGGDV